MTIVEALKIVMNGNTQGMTSREAYEKIIEKNLYSFPAKDPAAVVNATIRKHCLGIDFPACSRTKVFFIVDYKGKKPLYALIKENSTDDQAEKPVKTFASDSEKLPEEKIQEAYKEHVATVENALVDQIMINDPSFFEIRYCCREIS